MTNSVPPALYKKYHVDRDYENLSLFEQLVERYSIQSVLYPGCYVHITPSLCIPRAVYVDLESPAKKFFDDPGVLKYVKERKSYDGDPSITFYHQSYNDPIPEQEGSFDLLISQYAGFISEATKKYLKKGGILIANNSHGDAGLASIDSDFKLVAVVNKREDKFVISDKDLDQYFVPKKKIDITKKYLKDLGRGLGYTKTATNYIFKRL